MSRSCSRCDQSVFHAEQVSAVGKFFHKQCFTCYVPECNRLLDSRSFNSHDGQVYCSFCYKELFGPSGVGYGILSVKKVPSERELISNASHSVRRYDDDEPLKTSSQQSTSVQPTVLRHVPKPAVTVPVLYNSMLSRSSHCQRCQKRVYEAEKMVAAGKIWHKSSCFRCLSCGKSLEPGKYSEREHDIFCHKCYAKEFGPKGIGYGNVAAIQMHQ